MHLINYNLWQVLISYMFRHRASILNEPFGSIYQIARQDTLRILQLDEISSYHKDQDMSVYIIHTKYK